MSKYIIKEDILRNVFEILAFSCYRTGLDKVKLIAYHYICRYLEDLVIPFKADKKIHKVRGFVVPLEVFRYDLVRLLCYDDTMKKFIFTMKELIMKWVANKIIKSCMRKITCFGILSEYMSEYLPKHANYVVIEGIYSPCNLVNIPQPKIDGRILYSGTLAERYGIKNLLLAFNLLKNDQLSKLNINDIYTYCKSLSKQTEIRENYLDNDISILMEK